MPRPVLQDVNSPEDVLSLLHGSKKIIVITGAGISVSCGIPDFRSKENGLYNTLDCSAFGIPSAELLFDLEFFQIDPEPFYRFAPSLLPKEEMRPSISHNFIALLEKKKKLLRNYSQNVDGLERKTGMNNVFECHGTMAKFYCTGPKCSKKKTLEELVKILEKGEVVFCDSCHSVMKPGVTFFGEKIPKAFDRCIEKDIPKVDLVIVIGTSLKVGGSVYELVKQIPHHVPQILINKEPVALPSSISDGFDVNLLGNCDDVVSYLSERLEWTIASQIDGGLTRGSSRETESQPSSLKCDGDDAGGKRARESQGMELGSKRKKMQSERNQLIFPPSVSWQCTLSSHRSFFIDPLNDSST